MCGSPLPVWAFHDSFMAQISSQGMGADYLATLEAAATPEMMIAMFAVTFVCGLRALPCAGHVQEALREGGARVMEARALRRDGLGEGTLLGRRKRKGFLALDPRTLMGVLVAASVLAFAEKSLTVSCASSARPGFSSACRVPEDGAGFVAAYAALLGILCFVFPNIGGVAATMFTSASRSRARLPLPHGGRASYLRLSVHRLGAALAKLRLPQTVLVPLTVTLRYFPTLKEEASHIRDAMALRESLSATGPNASPCPL